MRVRKAVLCILFAVVCKSAADDDISGSGELNYANATSPTNETCTFSSDCNAGLICAKLTAAAGGDSSVGTFCTTTCTRDSDCDGMCEPAHLAASTNCHTATEDTCNSEEECELISKPMGGYMCQPKNIGVRKRRDHNVSSLNPSYNDSAVHDEYEPPENTTIASLDARCDSSTFTELLEPISPADCWTTCNGNYKYISWTKSVDNVTSCFCEDDCSSMKCTPGITYYTVSSTTIPLTCDAGGGGSEDVFKVCKNTNCRDGETYNTATNICEHISFCNTQANKSVTCGDHATCYHDRDMADHECRCDDIDGLVSVDNYKCACKSPLVFKNETCINPLNASEPAATDNKNTIVGASIGGVLVVIIGYAIFKIRKNRDNSDESSSQVPLLGEATLARL